MRSHKQHRLRALRQSCGYYLGAIVLGLNDALVELTGALAGFTMTLQDNRLIAMAGLTTGVAATLLMAASEFLATRADETSHPYISASYTGLTYLGTTAFLLLPYFFLESTWTALACSLVTAFSIIAIFTWLESSLRGESFLRNCLQMMAISFGVAALSFAISWGAQALIGVRGI